MHALNLRFESHNYLSSSCVCVLGLRTEMVMSYACVRARASHLDEANQRECGIVFPNNKITENALLGRLVLDLRRNKIVRSVDTASTALSV